MIRVKLHTNWCDDIQIREEFNKSSIHANYKWDQIELVLGDTYDYFVILNRPRYNTFDPKKTIIFQCETKSTRDSWGYWGNPDKKHFFFVHSTEEYNNFDKWYLNMNYQQLLKSPTKDKVLSGILSSNYFLPGHQQRLNFAFNHLSKLDYYHQCGRGFGDNQGTFFKGELKNKEDGLLSYKYTFNAENNREMNYFTEKFIDGLLCETLLFYDGCPNVDKFFDPYCYIKVDMTKPEEALNIIKSSIENNEWEKRIDCIREQKRKLMNELNPLNVIQDIILKNR